MLRRLYTDPAAPSAFSSLRKLQQAVAATSKQIKTPAAAASALSSPHTLRRAVVSHAPSKRSELKQKTPSQIKAWLETQDAYTLHRPLRKRFPIYIYKYDAVRTVLYTSSGGWWRRAWHSPRLFRLAIRTARTRYREFSSRAMENRATRTLERCQVSRTRGVAHRRKYHDRNSPQSRTDR